MLHLVVAPGGTDDGVRDGAASLLVLQWHAVGESVDGGEFVRWNISAPGDSRLDLEGITTVDTGLSSNGDDQFWIEVSAQCFGHQVFTYGREAVGGRSHDPGLSDCLVQDLDIFCRNPPRMTFGIDSSTKRFRFIADFPHHVLGYTTEFLAHEATDGT